VHIYPSFTKCLSCFSSFYLLLFCHKQQKVLAGLYDKHNGSLFLIMYWLYCMSQIYLSYLGSIYYTVICNSCSYRYLRGSIDSLYIIFKQK
jgi:hypothetical protein